MAKDQRREANPNWRGGRRIDARGYVLVHQPKHPRASSSGYVLEHVLIAEQALGKPLPEGAQVHHVDGDPGNNAPGNLVICQDQAYHKLLHRRQRALEACGHADWLRCWVCKEWDEPANLRVEPRNTCHPACQAKWQRERIGPSEYMGVIRRGNTWRVEVRLTGKTVFAQTFDDEREAARAYDLVLIELALEDDPRRRLNVHHVIEFEPAEVSADAWDDEPWFEIIQPQEAEAELRFVFPARKDVLDPIQPTPVRRIAHVPVHALDECISSVAQPATHQPCSVPSV